MNSTRHAKANRLHRRGTLMTSTTEHAIITTVERLSAEMPLLSAMAAKDIATRIVEALQDEGLLRADDV